MVFDNQTIKIIVMVLFSVLPSLIYFLLRRSFKRYWQQKLRNIRWIDAYYEYELFNQSCQYSAWSRSWEGIDWRVAGSLNQSPPGNAASTPESSSQASSDCQGAKYYIGELSCRYNALSPYIRCAVNPEGPCENCIHYEKKY